MDIEKSFKRLLIKNPFYGLFCLSLPKVVTRKVDTLCVTKQGISCQLNVNPDFWEKHTDEEQIALLMHELGHICFQHMFMHESFADQKLFNVSADCEVNSYIENLPKDGCTPAWLSQKIGKKLEEGIGTKKYYEAIQDYLNQQQQKAQAQNPQKPCNGGQGGSSQQNSQNSQSNFQNSSQNSQGNQQDDSQQSPSSSSSPSEAIQDDSPQKEEQQPSSPQGKTQDDNEDSQEQNQGQQEKGNNEGEDSREEEQESQYPDEFKAEVRQFDDHSTWDDFDNVPEATKQLMQNNINTILKNTAEQVEKMHSTIPGEFSELIEKLRQKKPEVFNWKAYFRRLLGSIYDVNIRSTRRKESKRFAEAAGIQHKKKVSILIAVDTSGSVSKKELQEFFSEIDYAYKAGARITILQCDTRINAVEEYDGKNIPEIKGRGGTDFNPPVDYYIKHKKEYASLIYFTDGECELPRRHPSGMVWVISSNGLHQDFPGKTIYIPPTNPNNN